MFHPRVGSPLVSPRVTQAAVVRDARALRLSMRGAGSLGLIPITLPRLHATFAGVGRVRRSKFLKRKQGNEVLIKTIDDRAEELAQLEEAVRTLRGADGKLAADELRRRKAGLKGEADAAYLIDFHFAPSKNRMVIHDLRLEHEGRVAQIDHLIISRFMDCYVLESKHFHAGIKITEQGEFLRWNDFKKTYEGMESPIEQNDRHITVLKDVMRTLDLPVRLGVRMMPKFRSLVLVSAKSRIDRPKGFDTSRVIKADQIKKSILDDVDNEGAISALMAKLVSPETAGRIARQLAALHRPVKWTMPERSTPTIVPSKEAERVRVIKSSQAVPLTGSPPSCKKCSSQEGTILHGKYGYYFKCAACGGNTAIRFECLPDHKPRLRKEGNAFFRECAECGTSQRYFVN